LLLNCQNDLKARQGWHRCRNRRIKTNQAPSGAASSGNRAEYSAPDGAFELPGVVSRTISPLTGLALAKIALVAGAGGVIVAPAMKMRPDKTKFVRLSLSQRRGE
jgi:hypothetical protein